MKKLILSLSLIVCSMPLMADAPFGLKVGMSLDDLIKIGGKPNQLGGNGYSFNSVPLPYAGFQDYVMTITPQNGLCKVVGFGKHITTSSYGDGVKLEFSAIKESLVAKYGKPKNNFDFLKVGSPWRNPSDWMMGLYSGGRVLTTTWEPNETDGIKNIMLTANARNRNEGYITLSYELSNVAECRAEKVVEIKDVRGL